MGIFAPVVDVRSAWSTEEHEKAGIRQHTTRRWPDRGEGVSSTPKTIRTLEHLSKVPVMPAPIGRGPVESRATIRTQTQRFSTGDTLRRPLVCLGDGTIRCLSHSRNGRGGGNETRAKVSALSRGFVPSAESRPH